MAGSGASSGSFFSGFIQRLARNWAVIFSGTTVAAVLGLLGVIVAARALDPAIFGILVVMQTYARVVDGVFNFQSHQAVIKFGTDALVDNDNKKYVGLLKFGFALDLFTSLISLSIAWLGLLFFAHLLGLEGTTKLLALTYCLVIPTNLAGTPIAVLRLHERYGLVALREVLNQSLRVVGGLVLWFADAGLAAFVILWLFSEVAGNILLIVFAAREFFRRGFRSVKASHLRAVPGENAGLWPALFNTNLMTGIRLLSDEGDVLFVNSALGPAVAGAYRIAKQFASVLLRMGRPLQEAVYPELAKLWAKGERKEFALTSLRVGLISGGVATAIWIMIWFCAELAIKLTIGEQYAIAQYALVALAFAHVIFLYGITVTPTILTMKKSHSLLITTIIPTIIFFSSLPILVDTYGIVGAGISQVIFNSVWLMLSILIITRTLRKYPA